MMMTPDPKRRTLKSAHRRPLRSNRCTMGPEHAHMHTSCWRPSSPLTILNGHWLKRLQGNHPPSGKQQTVWLTHPWRTCDQRAPRTIGPMRIGKSPGLRDNDPDEHQRLLHETHLLKVSNTEISSIEKKATSSNQALVGSRESL